MKDRQKNPEIPLRMPIALPVRFKNTTGICQVQTVNISSGGMFVQTNQYIRPGSQIDLEFDLNSQNTVRTKAKIVWATEGIIGNAAMYTRGLGIQFVNLPTQARKQIEQLSESFRDFP